MSSAAAAAPFALEVLVLGMAFVTAEYAAIAERTAAVGTTSAPARDRARLLQLQASCPQMHLITLNMAQKEEDCMPGQHVEASFDQRVVKQLLDKFGTRFVLHRIFLDYFRFPSDYMLTAYGPFMLPKLIELGLFTDGTEMVVPNLPALLQLLVGKKFQRQVAADDGSMALKACFLRFDPLAATDYPLYAATDSISTDNLGGYSNSQQIAHLDKDNAFVRVRITEEENESAQQQALSAAAVCHAPFLLP